MSTHLRRVRLGRFLGLGAGALILAFGVLPADAQSDDNGAIVEPRNGFTASFNNTGLNAGNLEISEARLTGSGTFTYTRNGPLDQRTMRSVTITAEAEGRCEIVADGESTPLEGDPQTHIFTFSVSSPCNQTVTLNAQGKADFGSLGAAVYQTMSADITFAVPAKPVTDLSVSVPDIDSRDVTVSWSKPDGSESDTTYQVQRRSPDRDRWTDISNDREFVDTVKDIGVYEYRVLAMRRGVDPVQSNVVEAHVGVEPTTTTSPDDDESTTTITQPGGSAPISRGGGSGGGASAHTTGQPQAPVTVTTIDTGFEETLDYHLDDIEPGELAAEGQSILNTEEATGVIGPGAVGASVLVMAGWAGHYLYFRRLAAQF